MTWLPHVFALVSQPAYPGQVATIDPYSGTPVYRQIADLLRTQISDGQIEAGSFLPSTRALMQEHDVAKMTAERAVRVLRDEGLIRSIPGRGFWVIPEDQRER